MFAGLANVKWFADFNQLQNPWKNKHFWVDTFFLFLITIISLLYLSFRHFNDFKKKII